ncbi:MAG: phenylalanine--tRNA ligase subunit alpha [Tissierellia bacterium]|nr:phenylalanine--tRNA ligase subunit alpha [Tissierellia bacterium]
MIENLEKLRKEVLEAVESAKSLDEIEKIRVANLGKKGTLTAIMKGMGKLSAEERPKVGAVANTVREDITNSIEQKFSKIKKALDDKKLKAEKIDISLEKHSIIYGHEHPLMKTMKELEDLFVSMGFSVITGPEIESVENNFDALNSPEDHPSRDMSDTFYIDKTTLLRTHTSPVQVRAMKKYGAPIKMVSPGRTFRFDDVDDTHSPMFHQIEGLVVDEGISMADMIGTVNIFIKSFLGEHIETRWRPHYFPFTEPSAEVDVTCHYCDGEGCKACSMTGWSMELLGCGMVHPKVLQNCGIDPEKYTGFAFGMGIDRIAMVKYGISDLRLLFDNDNRFLNQF